MANVRVFVDFWNFQIELKKKTDGKYSADWKKLPQWLIGQAEDIVESELE